MILDKSKAIEMLKQCLEEIPQLRELHYDNQKFNLWRDKVRDIIKAALDSDDLARFSVGSWKIRGIFADDVYQREYLEEHLPKYETGLKSIIQKYELLEIEAEPSAVAKPKDTTESPTQIFDKMQFHQRIIAASKSLFESGHYSQAIFEAFKAVNNFVKEKSGLSLDGKALMSKVFNEDAPIIKLNELLTQSDKDEQEGFKFLFMGAMVGIRNPKAHDFIEMKDPYKTLEYLAFASLLLKKISFWKVD